MLWRHVWLWSAPTCRRFVIRRFVAGFIVTSRDIKAVTGHRTPNKVAYQFFAAASASSSSSFRRQ